MQQNLNVLTAKWYLIVRKQNRPIETEQPSSDQFDEAERNRLRIL